jgi:small-conductance mechanosensitive channel
MPVRLLLLLCFAVWSPWVLGQPADPSAPSTRASAGWDNPYSLANIAQWLLVHGPRIGIILGGTLAVYILVRFFARRIADLVARAAVRGSEQERANRAKTLVGVFQQTAQLVVLLSGGVMLLDECGIPIKPVLGGAAVLGLAVAFGAQNLLRDYFAGVMILLEDQYAVGDVVRIGSTTGMVERLTLRMTMLRDLEGIAHFIPHGTITSISNLSHTWSQAVTEVGVAYGESVDQVMAVLADVARRLRADPAFADMILADPEVQGVMAFADSAVTLRVLIKTRPLKQWPVKRELLRRIKNRFDELGIEIPFPHRTVYLRREEPEPAANKS